ncbi:MAG: hypothetical protein HY292_11655 [Planctomycetes bacterium]|nr:hypothetical protein [Planctomycetota bacterium]
MMETTLVNEYPDRGVPLHAQVRGRGPGAWGHVVRVLQRVKGPQIRRWFTRSSIQHGWSHSALELQVDRRAHERHGTALTTFEATPPPGDSGLQGSLPRRLSRHRGPAARARGRAHDRTKRRSTITRRTRSAASRGTARS